MVGQKLSQIDFVTKLFKLSLP